jgi:two-component system sensor histidine kinase KdpD
MLVVALTLSTLTNNIKYQAEMARQRERRTAALYAMTKEQAVAATKNQVVAASAKHVKEVFDSDVAICLSNGEGALAAIENLDSSFSLDSHELGVAQWVFSNGQMAGVGTSTLPGARAIYLPLRGSSKIIGVIGVRSADSAKFLPPEELHLLEIFVNQIALAIERATLAEQLHKTNGQRQTPTAGSSSSSAESARQVDHIG